MNVNAYLSALTNMAAQTAENAEKNAASGEKREGETFRAQVTGQKDGIVMLRTKDGMRFSALAETDRPLQPGQTVDLTVIGREENGMPKVAVSRDGGVRLSSYLSAMGAEDTSASRALAAELIGQRVSVTPRQFASLLKHMEKNPELTPQKAAFMFRHNIPITPQTIAQYNALAEPQAQLGSLLDKLLGVLERVMERPQAGPPAQQSPVGDAPLRVPQQPAQQPQPATPQQPTTPQQPAQQSPVGDAPPRVPQQPAQQPQPATPQQPQPATPPQPQPTTPQQPQPATPQQPQPTTPQQPQPATPQQPQPATPQQPTQQSPVGDAPLRVPQQPAQQPQPTTPQQPAQQSPVGDAPLRVPQQPAQQPQPITPQQPAQQSPVGDAPPHAPQQPAQQPQPTAPQQPQQSQPAAPQQPAQVQQPVAQPSLVDTLNALFRKIAPERQGILPLELDASRLTREIGRLVSDVLEAARRLPDAQRSEVVQVARDIVGSLRFAEQLNQCTAFAQLPVQIGKEKTTAQLYVFNDSKSTKKKIDPQNATMFVSLATANLGQVEGFVKVIGKNVEADFSLVDEDTSRVFRAGLPELSGLLEAQGFRLARVGTTVSKAPSDPASVEKTHEAIKGRYNLDIRV